jgi:ubiquinone/menaquinone biosynthesis C-methylase UbiE
MMSKDPKPSAGIHWTPSLYNKISKVYDLAARLFFPIGKKGHLKVIEAMREGSILDVACGTGTLLAMASQIGMCCYGVDTSKGMLSQAYDKVPQANLRLASFYEMPFSDSSFDYVVETNAVSGVEIEAERVLKEMIRVCKVGGEIRIADYAKPPRPSGLSKFMERMLIWVGDFAYDYKRTFGEFGYDPDVEILGWNGMYQFIRVKKTA